jgi:hypothetical protein
VRQISERGTVLLAAQAREEVGASLVEREQLAFEARLLEIAPQVLQRLALAAGRVDRVEADQPLE